MGNIDINTIRERGFEQGSEMAKVEKYCRTTASEHTDGLIELYNVLVESRNGRYINSDLMKMVFPFYAKSQENRREYNMAISNSAAVLTNEAYRRAIQNKDIKRCVYMVGPYGAGKSYFAQSLFNETESGLQEGDIIVYEGSITPPAFEEKIKFAIDNGVTPEIIALNPTLELSMRNIKERAKRIGRDVEKGEVVDKYANLYGYLKDLLEKFTDIPFVIYNKENNLDLSNISVNIEDLNHGSMQEIEAEYDRIEELLKREEDVFSLEW